MTNLFDRFFNRSQQKTARTAKERLQFVLVTDRSELSPEQLRQMQAEILDVIRKYCRIDEQAVDMKLEARERSNYLVADIPLRKSNPNSDEDPGRIAFMMQTNEGSDTASSDNDNHQTPTASTDAESETTTTVSATPETAAKATENATDETKASAEDNADTDDRSDTKTEEETTPSDKKDAPE
jgi:cell division topological specificity factor